MGREAAFPGCPTEMLGGNLGSLSHGGRRHAVCSRSVWADTLCVAPPGLGSFFCTPRRFLSHEGEAFLCPRPDPSEVQQGLLAFLPGTQYTNRCLLKWLKLWDTVVFGKEKAVKKAKPSAEAHPPSNQPKEQQNKWKTKVQLTEEILEAELDQHKRPKYKVSRTGGRCGGSPLLSLSSHRLVRSSVFQYRSSRNWIPCFSLAITGFSHFFFCFGSSNVITRGGEQAFSSQIKWTG